MLDAFLSLCNEREREVVLSRRDIVCAQLGSLHANIAPQNQDQANSLVGLQVEHLCDAHGSVHGPVLSEVGTVRQATGRSLSIDGNWFAYEDIREMRVLPRAGDLYDVWSDGLGGVRTTVARSEAPCASFAPSMASRGVHAGRVIAASPDAAVRQVHEMLCASP